MAALTRFGGAATGAATTLGLRQSLDQAGAAALRQPSVLVGLGSAVVAGGLFISDADVLPVQDDLLAAHAATAGSLGALSAVFPKRQNTNVIDQLTNRLLGGGGSRRTSDTGNGQTERATAGTARVTTESLYGGSRRNVGSN
jgi:hypothetical protein